MLGCRARLLNELTYGSHRFDPGTFRRVSIRESVSGETTSFGSWNTTTGVRVPPP